MFLKILKNYSDNQTIYAKNELEKLILQKFNKNYYIDKNNDGKPIFYNGIYWSISHKNQLCFIGASKKRIGIDIEIIKKRSEEFLDIFTDKEYQILGGKNWINFYILWTTKESIIKYNLGNLDDMKDIVVEGYNSINEIHSGILFNIKLTGNNNGDKFRILSGMENNIIYAITY